ncbi:hypothetical protein V8G54_025145 [Vigna mungo]|uniref:Uncharacterized protein n=1 Tax=Vigna mungo TaxID=3915 RepID=A0AAQ3RTU5_VIGMU
MQPSHNNIVIINLPFRVARRMFYFFFESRKNKNDPVVIWLTGGPGCGSELALFYENGPFHITKNLSLTWNDYGWDQVPLFNFHVFFMETLINLHQSSFILCINNFFFSFSHFAGIKYYICGPTNWDRF